MGHKKWVRRETPSHAQAQATWLAAGNVEKHSGLSGEQGGAAPESQLRNEPNPRQLVGEYQQTKKSK